MVEPEIAENTVPATITTTGMRPGTRAIRRSMAVMARIARPDWNSMSPMKMNSGIGTSENDETPSTPLRTSCCRPASPPRKYQAPARFSTRKAKATGRPLSISTMMPPSSSTIDSPQGMACSLP